MNQTYSISIYLDTRRVKSNGKFPVKLRVYLSATKKQMLYATLFEFTKKEFESIWNTTKPRKEFKELRLEIQSIENKANAVAKELHPFTIDQFEKRLYRKSGDGINLDYNYNQIISELTKRGQIGTANSYETSRNSLDKFCSSKKNQSFAKLTLYDVTVDWLKDYEHFMTNIEKRSVTTVGIYLRTVRAIFNRAIDEKEIDKEYYPFGKRKYQIPTTKNVKKALNKEQLNTLLKAKPKTKEQQKAKDFWFFSYACNGMNIKDIALLKYKDIENGKIEFIREKTKITSRASLKPITFFLNDYSHSIIKKYGAKNEPENYIFGVVNDNMTPQQQQAKIKAFTRFINQHLKKLAKEIELPEDISTYWARHSFATNSVRKGATMEFIQESLGHGSISTTQSYFAGFDDETKKEFANAIMDFE